MKRLKILSDKVVRSLTEERKSRALNNDIRNIKRENAVRGGHANSDRLEALSYFADNPWEERKSNRLHLRDFGDLPLIKDSRPLVNSSGSNMAADLPRWFNSRSFVVLQKDCFNICRVLGAGGDCCLLSQSPAVRPNHSV